MNDRLLGLAGSDVMNGGAGEDALYGGEGSDVLNGGTGDDMLVGGEGADIYVINAGSGTDTLIDSEGGQIELGVGISLMDIDARRDGHDMVMRLPDAAACIVIPGYFDVPQVWEIRDTSGGRATADELLAGTAARELEWVQAQKNDYEQASKLALANERISQGYRYSAANELRRYEVSDALAGFVSGNQTQINQTQWINGGTSTQVLAFSLNDWRTQQNPSVRDDRLRIETSTIQATAEPFSTGAWGVQQSSYGDQRWVGLNWTTTYLSSEQSRQWSTTNFATASYGRISGVGTSSNVLTYQTGFASGHVTGILSQPPTIIPPSNQLFPNVGQAYYSGSDVTYTFQIVRGDEGSNTITCLLYTSPSPRD